MYIYMCTYIYIYIYILDTTHTRQTVIHYFRPTIDSWRVLRPGTQRVDWVMAKNIFHSAVRASTAVAQQPTFRKSVIRCSCARVVGGANVCCSFESPSILCVCVSLGVCAHTRAHTCSSHGVHLHHIPQIAVHTLVHKIYSRPNTYIHTCMVLAKVHFPTGKMAGKKGQSWYMQYGNACAHVLVSTQAAVNVQCTTH